MMIVACVRFSANRRPLSLWDIGVILAEQTTHRMREAREPINWGNP
jgi:hypothetical protein